MARQLDEQRSKSRRIASNSLVLFARMMAIMVINLYAVRVVLRALGQSDYGVFNAVAGVVLTSTFLTSTLAVSVQRFYSYAIGQQTGAGRLSEIFSASMNIIAVIVAVLVLFFETAGLWFVCTQLNIPPERAGVALWLYQFAVLSFVLTFVQIPYTAAIFANEDMGLFAVVSLAECVGKLIVALLIGVWASCDGLLFYGAGLLVVSVLIFATYALSARRRYAECHYSRRVDKGLYKELLSFSGWATYSALSGMTVVHGNTLLLNIFFGPVATAAYAIANQIHNAMIAVSNSIVIAFRPAMVKAYASKDYAYLDRLFSANNKFILYLLLCVSVPLVTEMPLILRWWLGEATGQMTVFSRLFIVFMVVMVMNNPITTIIHSTGKIKRYILWVDSITLLCIPLSWTLYKLGLPDYSTFLSMIGVYSVAHIVRLICLHNSYPQFSSLSYLRTIVVPGVAVTLLSSAFAYLLHESISREAVEFLAVMTLSPVATLTLSYIVGLSKDERRHLHSFLRQYVKLKNHSSKSFYGKRSPIHP